MEPVTRALGRADYEPVWRAMQAFTKARDDATPDELWFVEHPPVFTLGLAARPEHVLDAGAIPVVRIDRGGQVTYHGPGQLVAYVLVDLNAPDTRGEGTVRRLELIRDRPPCAYRSRAPARGNARGVRCRGHRCAAVGLRVSRGCTYHGISLNVDADSPHSRASIPAGIRARATRLADLGVREVRLPRCSKRWQAHLAAPLFAALKPRHADIRTPEGKLERSAPGDRPHPHQGWFRPEPLRKPSGSARAPAAGRRFHEIKKNSARGEVNNNGARGLCPNIGECFGHGTATFMIMVDLCTRRCPFCDVPTGARSPWTPDEPRPWARRSPTMGLRYVVITRRPRRPEGGGAQHFVDCIRAVRDLSPGTRLEILTRRFPAGASTARLAILARRRPTS